MKIDFRNKTVLITGATRGIGQAIAKEFKLLGADLILTGTNINEINQLNKLQDKSSKVKYYYLDFLKKNSLIEFTENILRYKKIDVLINNAGINKINYIYEFDDDDWEDIIKVNLSGAFHLCKVLGNKMKNQNEGRIINIASIFGTITRSKRVAYTASKAALIGLTKTVSVDLAPYGVLVNSISPGFIETDLTRSILGDDEITELETMVPIGRLGKPEEISKLVLFLASKYNTFITGQNIIIDGGYVNV